MTDLIDKLRNPLYAADRIEFLECRIETANELEQKQQRIERLEGVLQWIDEFADPANPRSNKTTPRHQMMIEIRKVARKTLLAEDGDD